MYISLCAIRSWNWNWKLTQDHFLIEHWIKRPHRCSARVVGLEEYWAHDWRAATSVQRSPVTWCEWSLWSYLSLSPSTRDNTNSSRHVLLLSNRLKSSYPKEDMESVNFENCKSIWSSDFDTLFLMQHIAKDLFEFSLQFPWKPHQAPWTKSRQCPD